MLVDPTAEELAAIYADGITEGAKLVEMEVDLDQLNERALEWARRRAADLVTQIEENTRDMLRDTVARAIEEGWSADELAGQIADSTGFSDDRAETIARTELIAANNAGNLRAYKESGVATLKEWATAGDDLVEEECQANEDQGPIGLDEAFDSGDGAPPAHPNAVFEGSLFAPYGRLYQALRSRYDGASMTITTILSDEFREWATSNASETPNLYQGMIFGEHPDGDGDPFFCDRGGGSIGIIPRRVSLAVGPNHPILTRRGFVVADEICEGDQLIYDTRMEFAAGGAEFDFEQMPLIEDAFSALALSCGNSVIAGPGTYFHGDEVFAHGEVQVVRPTRDLLPILNPGRIEKLCECGLTGAYADAAHVAGCGACLAAFDRVFLTAARGVGGGLPFVVATVTDCHSTTFSGWAFDASTESQLYNYGGLVVKNCRCSILPVIEPLDESTDEEE